MSAARNLTNLKIGEKARISQVHTTDKETHHKLIAMGILPGTEITLIATKPTYLFSIGHTRFAVDTALSQNILIL